jgi:hypothetical protein
VEDKISVRKMDITPSNSTEFKETTELSNSSEIQNQGQYGKSLSKNGNDFCLAHFPKVVIYLEHPLDIFSDKCFHFPCRKYYVQSQQYTHEMDDSDDRSQGSTLKESQENIIPGQRPYFKNDIYSEGNKTDFEKVMKVSSAVTGSSGHVIIRAMSNMA